MFGYKDRSWIDKSVIAENADAEITFSLQRAFHPNPNALDERNAIALPAPAIPSADPYNLSSKEVLNNERPLAEHYKAVLQLACHHAKPYVAFNLHMWLRLHFRWNEGAISFPWYDTLEEMERLFGFLNDAVDGQTWSGVEQGWDMIAVRVGSRFHFREGNSDQGVEHANIALPREDLVASISRLRERMRIII